MKCYIPSSQPPWKFSDPLRAESERCWSARRFHGSNAALGPRGFSMVQRLRDLTSHTMPKWDLSIYLYIYIFLYIFKDWYNYIYIYYKLYIHVYIYTYGCMIYPDISRFNLMQQGFLHYVCLINSILFHQPVMWIDKANIGDLTQKWVGPTSGYQAPVV